MDINKIINIVRTLREEAPTMSLGAGKIAGTVEAGDQPPVDLRRGKRRNWNPFFKDLAKMQRRKPSQ
ncbi:MAG: hypothetical protein ACO25L_02345 [Candidatus Nanopelagicales bacterium]|nr:hypothetical protein [Synechococcus phage DSL-LC03]